MISTADLYEVFKKHPLVCTDTRSLSKDCLFFALRGPSFNGNTFAGAALEQGAAFVIVDDPYVVKDERYLLVPDALVALQELARFHRRTFSIPVLAITGSNGKTTTKELIRNVLSIKYKTLATQGNLNNHIGVPLTLLRMTAATEFAVIEMGANHQGEIAAYCKIAEPDYGLITNVGKAHLEGFGGFEGVKKGKGELYAFLANKGKMVFIQADNPHLREMAATHRLNHVYRYGQQEGADCRGSLIAEHPGLEVRWETADTSGTCRASITGAYNFENVLSAIAIGTYFGVTAASISEAITAYVPDNSRSQIIERGSNKIILDAYNANPTSMEAALLNFHSLSGEHKMVLLGEMAELGDHSREEHDKLIEQLKGMKLESVILVGAAFQDAAQQLSCHCFPDSKAAAAFLKSQKLQHKTVLIKGSRSSRMELMLEAFV